MLARSLRIGRIPLVLSSAFLLGAGSAEVAVRTSAAIDRVKHERETGTAGQLVQLQLSSPEGEVLARPRVIAPVGKATEIVLHDPANPGEVRLAFRVEAVREPTGFIALVYSLWVPERAISATGRLSLTPGVEQAMELGEGAIVASFLAVPVPSAAFDAYLETEATRRGADKTS